MNFTRLNFWTKLTAVMLVGVVTALPQLVTTATITGTAMDATGAIVPSTAVDITNQQTKVVIHTATNDTGTFAAPGLTVGTYKVTFTKAGFEAYTVEGIVLHPAIVATVNGMMHPGEVRTAIDVQASAAQVELSTPELSNQVSAEQVGTLPLNGRNYQSLAALMPGVTNVAPGKSLNQGGFTTTNVMSVNGMSISGTMYYVDGIWDMDTGDMTQETITPNPDEIQEVRVLQNNYGVQYSLNGANVVLLQTKSGTNQFHGSAWEYLRNDALNARNYFSQTVLPYKQNIFGFSLGGPAYIPRLYNTAKTRTFFYWNEQWVRQRVTQSPLTGITPTAAQRSGLFSTLVKNPVTGQPYPTNSAGQYVVPVSAASVALANAVLPLPNYSNPSNPSLNYINTDPLINNQRDDMVKLDAVLSEKFHLAAELLHAASLVTYPNESILGSPFNTIKSTRNTPNYLVQMQLTQIYSSNIVNTSGIAMNRYITQLNDVGTTERSQVPNFSENLPYNPAIAANLLPEITFSQGYSLFGIALNVPQPAATDLENTATDDFSLLRGHHYIQAGIQQIFGTKRQTSFEQANGLFNFTGIFTGNALADFLIGEAHTFNQGNGRPRYYLHFDITSPYLQDRWQVTSRLTLTAGLRYEYMPTVASQNMFESAFVPSNYLASHAPIVNSNGTITPTSGYDPLNGLVINGENGIPNNFSSAHENYLAPAVGFAYDLFGDGKTSLRGGWGLTYYNNFFSTCGQSCDDNPPFVQSITLNNANFPNPVGALQSPAGAPTIASEDIARMRDPSIQSFSLSLQHQFGGNWFASIAGAGNLANHLPQTYNLNQPLRDGAYDFNPAINSGNFTYLYGPYLGYAAINQSTYEAFASWNALEANLRHSLGHNFFLSVAYTWQHGLSEARTNNMFALSAVQDIYNPHANYGNSNVNVPQIFTVSGIYSFPQWGAPHSFRNELLGQWQISDITTIQSGASQEIGLSTSTRGIATRPNVVPGQSINGPKTVNEWFNTAAFTAPAPGYFGNVAPGKILGPGIVVFDLALYKDFSTWREQKLQFRVEAFNAFNHTNFSAVNTNYGAAAFGNVTAAADARVLEGVLRYEF